MRIDTVGMKRKIVWPWLLQSVSLQKHLGGIRALYDIRKKWISRILQRKFSMKSKGIYLIILTNVHLMNCQIQLVFKCIVLLFLWIYVHILIHVSAFQLNRKKKTTIQILFILNNAASMATANRTCEKAKMSNHPGKQTTYCRNEFNILCCVHVAAAAATGETRPPQNRANVSWLGERKDGCHHVIALISKPWLRKRKRFTEVAASRGLVFPKWQRPQRDLDDEDGSVE